MTDEKPLQSLLEFNANRRAQYDAVRDGAQPNGIACPTCGGELVDSAPGTTLHSYPPQKNVYCTACQYRGYRLA